MEMARAQVELHGRVELFPRPGVMAWVVCFEPRAFVAVGLCKVAASASLDNLPQSLVRFLNP